MVKLQNMIEIGKPMGSRLLRENWTSFYSNHWSTTESWLGNTGRYWDLATSSYLRTNRSVAYMTYLDDWRYTLPSQQQSAHAWPTCDLTRGDGVNFTRIHIDKSHWLREKTCSSRKKKWSWEFRHEPNSLTEGVHLNEWTRQHSQLSSKTWLPVRLRVPLTFLDFKTITIAKNFRLPQRYASSTF